MKTETTKLQVDEDRPERMTPPRLDEPSADAEPAKVVLPRLEIESHKPHAEPLSEFHSQAEQVGKLTPPDLPADRLEPPRPSKLKPPKPKRPKRPRVHRRIAEVFD